MSPTLADQAYDEIREKIITGQLSPGERLVNRSLSADIGVSVIPVREALRRLASEGLVNHIPGSGTFVGNLDRDDVIDLYRFREAIECFAVREAIANIRDDQLRQLEAICEDWLNVAREIRQRTDGLGDAELFERGLKNDIAFHEILIKAASNAYLSKTLQDMRLLARVAHLKTRRAQSLHEAAKTYRQHATLLRAIKNKNVDEADHWMRSQIQHGLVQALNTDDDGNDLLRHLAEPVASEQNTSHRKRSTP